MKLNLWIGVAAGTFALVAACEQAGDVTGVDAFDPAFFSTALGGDLKLGQVSVCKEGPDGRYDFTVTANSAETNLPNGEKFSLAVPGKPTSDFENCLVAANTGPDISGGDATVSEKENVSTPLQKVVIYHITTNGVDPTTVTLLPPITGVNPGKFGPDNGYLLVFYNRFAGCTLTQGYWKTHNASFKGGAPVDPTWALLGALKELTPFFNSGTTWFGVFWTPPAGNAYYQLAHQYMAAKLNKLAGAGSTAGVDAAIAAAEGLFGAPGNYTPATAAALAKNSAARANFLALAGTLGAYNEGTAGGPDHCR